MSAPTRYAYLGPEGTFTEAALRRICQPGDELIPYANVTAALNAVRSGSADKALVPIENSVEGVVARTLDELATGEPLLITAETTLPVSFALMILPEHEGKPITRIATHPHAEAQCRSYVARELPGAEMIETPSTAAAAQQLGEGKWDAAIAATFAAEKYGRKIIASNIGENEGAVTRFIVAEKPHITIAPTGNDRTSLVAYIGRDHAGALLEILTEFAKQGVNLTFIQSRPTGLELGHYHFIIDVEGHMEDAPVRAALDGLTKICEDIRFLGSYPRVNDGQGK
jgi:prephenate dehydratase